MKAENLKEKARRHEQRDEWQKALDLYLEALGKHGADEPPDIALLNRVGDIQTRLGQVEGAVGHYETAIDLYMAAELPNNAIAICKKVIRNLPDRSIFFLRMGKIRAEQGFLTDARQNFLTYAEQMTANGDIEAALSALIEFVALSPEDLEIRLGLAAQLESHGRTEEAVTQYGEAYRRLVLMEQLEEADEIRSKVHELAPDAVLPDLASITAEETVEETDDLVLETTQIGGDGPLGSLESARMADLEVTGEFAGVSLPVGEEDAPAAEEDDAEPAGQALAAEGPAGFDEGLEVAEADQDTLPAFDLEAVKEAEDLPTFDFDAEEAEEEVEVLPTFDFEVEEEAEVLPTFDGDQEEDVGELLPTFGYDEGVLEGDEEPLPVLDLGGGEGEEIPAGKDRGEVFEDAVLEALSETFDEPAVLDEADEAEKTAPVPSFEDHAAVAERGDLNGAIEIVQTLIQSEPDEVGHYQRLVEYAFRKADNAVLVSAYMQLAGCLARTGAPTKAKAVYHQVVSLSPGHEGALAGIQAADGIPVTSGPAEVTSSEEYVDLGSMILGEEAEETTRWKVTAEAPSGDDQADFAKMLSQFKEKVSEHVAADDVSAHHDLGTAYMEMGLLEEAIGEFQMALRASPHHLPTHEVMGRCWMEAGKSEMAARSLRRALDAEFEVEDELIGIYYLMGRAMEDLGKTEEALEFFEKVFSLDINFEDVTERLRALR